MACSASWAGCATWDVESSNKQAPVSNASNVIGWATQHACGSLFKLVGSDLWRQDGRAGGIVEARGGVMRQMRGAR